MSDGPQGFGADYFVLHVLPRHCWLRQGCIRIVTHRYFDRLAVGVITTYVLILGLSDFSVVDGSLNPVGMGYKYQDGHLVQASSGQNRVVELSRAPFTLLLFVHCILTMLAMGLQGKGSYTRDGKNLADLFILAASILGNLPGTPNVSAIRLIRLLWLLRWLLAIRGTRLLCSALIKVLSALGNVVVVQVFVFFVFGILGIQLFGGSMNHRCRLTEFPVRLPLDNSSTQTIWPVPNDYLQQVFNDSESFKCLDANNDAGGYTKEVSPWNTPQDCYWPVDDNDEMLCSEPEQSGEHHCSRGMTCGSDYDAFGNPRFRNGKAMGYTLHRPSFNWGLTTFDNIGGAFFTIFQVITQEGWTGIMYMVMDSSQPVAGAIFFVVLIVLCSFVVMTLTVAILAEEFKLDQSQIATAETEKQDKELLAKQQKAEELRARRRRLNGVVTHRRFTGFVMVIALVNTMVLALDHYPMPGTMDSNLELANLALLVIFVVEMGMKLSGLGLRLYARDNLNRLDAFIVIVGILEGVASPPSFMSENPPKQGAVSVLRALRILRVFKLARGWGSLRRILKTIAHVVARTCNFGALFLLFIYAYALVGVQLFGNTMRFDAEGYPTPFTLNAFWNGSVPRNNFDTILWAAVTVFQVLTGENWNAIMFDVIRGNGMLACIYFISLVIIGKFLLMNLFVALLLVTFEADDEEQLLRRQENTLQWVQKMLSATSSKVAPETNVEQTSSKPSALAVSSAGDEVGEDIRSGDKERVVSKSGSSVPLAKTVYAEQTQAGERQNISSGGMDKKRRRNLRELLSERGTKLSCAKTEHTTTAVAGHAEGVQAAADPSRERFAARSLFLFSSSSSMRRWTTVVSTHPWLNPIIFGLIIVSCITLALDNPLANPNSGLSYFLGGLDAALGVAFMIEVGIKVIAMGLVLNKGSYLRSVWNVIDGVVVISSVIVLAPGLSNNLSSLRALRGVRSFRPLRLISRCPGLKLVVNAMFEAVPELVSVFFVCMFLFLVFSIVAVNYLKGGFNACGGIVFDGLSNDQVNLLVSPMIWGSLTDRQQSWFANSTCEGFPTDQLTSQYICDCWGADWGAVLPQNFDNVGSAMLTFFEISTTEGWADVMMAAIDTDGIGMQPIRDNNMGWALFFVIFIVIGSFGVVWLLVGVVIKNFSRMNAALGSDFMLTPSQKKWKARNAAARIGPVLVVNPPSHPFRRMLFFIVSRKWFERFVIIFIVINTLMMATQHFGESVMWNSIVNAVNSFVTLVIILEAVLKLAACGWGYFRDQWNQFDFFVVACSISGVVIESITFQASLAMLVRVLRVTRVFRLVKASKSIRQMLLAVHLALPGVVNIASLLFLLLFTYSALGVQLFAKVALSANVDGHANFQSFGNGFLLLFRTATGEAWNRCMHDLASSQDCVVDPPFDPRMCGFSDVEGCVPLNGCGNSIAYIFFCSFTLLVTYALLYLVVAFVLEVFSLTETEKKRGSESVSDQPSAKCRRG